MDGLECSEISLSHVKREETRFDSAYYSKENLLLQTIIDTAGNKTINEYGGVLDCSAFYPSITGYYSNDRSLIPFIRVNEIANGLISITDNTVFLPANIIEDNSKTIAVAYPGDIIIAKGGNTLAKVGLVTEEFPMYATCRDVIILRTTSLQGLNRHYLWAFLHSSFGQRMLWRSASQTGQPHLTLPAITKIKVPEYKKLQDKIEKLYTLSVCKKQESNSAYRDAETILLTVLCISEKAYKSTGIAVKSISESFRVTGRLDAEYYQPKYEALFGALSKFKTQKLGGARGLVSVAKSIEPGSEAYVEVGIPFVRVSDVSKYEISEPEIKLRSDILPNPEVLFPQKDTILLSKDGSVGIAYKVESTIPVITSGALLHLSIRNKEEVLPDYLTLVLNSPIVQLQAERDSNGAIIQHWKPSEIENVIIPVLDMSIQKEIATQVQESFALRKQSKQLLEYAKQAVEMAIEQGEDAALEWLKDKVD